jgi:hypothetical protein
MPYSNPSRSRNDGTPYVNPSNAWTPSKLSNVSDVWFWGQPSVFGADCPIEPTSPNGFVNKINNWGDRRLNGHSVKRFDGNQAGMPQWLGRFGPVRRPALYFSGSTLLISCVNNAGVSTPVQTTGGWTLAARICPGASSGGYFFGFGGVTAGVGAIAGTGVVVKNTAGQTFTNTATVSNAYNETVIVVTVRGTVVRVSVKDLVTGVTTIQSGTLAAGADFNSALFVGTNGNATVTFEGSVNELLFARTPCSDTDHDSLFTYLQSPYATALVTVGGTIMWGFGDSRMVGMDAGVGLVEMIATGMTTPGLIAHNAGLSGQTTGDMVTNFNSREGNLMIDTGACGMRQIVVVECAVNTCAVHPGNATAAFVDVQNYVALLKARDASAPMVFGNGGDRSGTGIYAENPLYHTDFPTFAQAYLDNAALLGILIANTAQDPLLGALNWQHNRTYCALDDFGGGNTAEVHFSPTGGAGCATKYRNALLGAGVH